jgi:DNA-binding transcriptional regulator YhcF (GntR family)
LTVKKAYDALEEENIDSTVHEKGTYINLTSFVQKQEETQLALEKELAEWISKAKSCNLNAKQIKDLVDLFLEEDKHA